MFARQAYRIAQPVKSVRSALKSSFAIAQTSDPFPPTGPPNTSHRVRAAGPVAAALPPAFLHDPDRRRHRRHRGRGLRLVDGPARQAVPRPGARGDQGVGQRGLQGRRPGVHRPEARGGRDRQPQHQAVSLRPAREGRCVGIEDCVSVSISSLSLEAVSSRAQQRRS